MITKQAHLYLEKVAFGADDPAIKAALKNNKEFRRAYMEAQAAKAGHSMSSDALVALAKKFGIKVEHESARAGSRPNSSNSGWDHWGEDTKNRYESGQSRDDWWRETKEKAEREARERHAEWEEKVRRQKAEHARRREAEFKSQKKNYQQEFVSGINKNPHLNPAGVRGGISMIALGKGVLPMTLATSAAKAHASHYAKELGVKSRQQEGYQGTASALGGGLGASAALYKGTVGKGSALRNAKAEALKSYRRDMRGPGTGWLNVELSDYDAARKAKSIIHANTNKLIGKATRLGLGGAAVAGTLAHLDQLRRIRNAAEQKKAA